MLILTRAPQGSERLRSGREESEERGDKKRNREKKTGSCLNCNVKEKRKITNRKLESIKTVKYNFFEIEGYLSSKGDYRAISEKMLEP